MARRAISTLLSSRWAPLTVLVTGLVCTIIVVFQLRDAAHARDQQRFVNTVQRIEDSILQRIAAYHALLRATAGMLGVDRGNTTRSEFEEFVDHMKLDQSYQGILGIGYSVKIRDPDHKQFITNMRREYPDFELTPSESAVERHAIVLIAPPSDENRKAIGYDMYDDTARRAAMEQARDRGEAVASGAVLLIQNEPGDKTPGFIIYFPVYSGGSVPPDIVSRRERLLGFAYSPFRVDKLFRSMFAPGDLNEVSLEIHDGAVTDGTSLLHQVRPDELEGYTSRFVYSDSVDILRRRWTLVARSTPAFDAAAPTPDYAAMAAIGGLLVTLALTGLTTLQTQARLAAETDRQLADKAKDEARTAAARLELVLKGARVGLWYSTLPFETLQWDDRVKAHFFLPPDEKEITVERAFERVHPDDRERIRAAMGWSIRAHAPFDVEYRTVSPDGTRMNWIRSIGQTFVDADGKAIRFDVLTIDVTTLKQGQESLAESEAKFRQLANSIPQLAWIARPDGWIFWFNQRWYDYTGTTLATMEGWGWKQAHHPDYLDAVTTKWQGAVSSGEAMQMEIPLRGANGRFGWFLMQAVPLRDAMGHVMFWFGTNTDLSEQRKLANEREQLLESERAARSIAERASQLKDEFLATLSHELRTPLNAILGWSQILRRQHNGNADLADGLSIIERNARVQTQLVSDLLDMSRVISGKLRLEAQVVDLAAVVSSAIESVRPAADAKEISLSQEFETKVGPVNGDPARLQQIVWNLLTNAIKFTPRAGRVRIGLTGDEDRVLLSVIDTGEGIRADFLPHLFERFRQADGSTTRRHGGLGLGLAIVKNLVELHGGRVWASSDGAGCGAGFFVELPALARSAAEDIIESGDPNGINGGPMLAADSLSGLRVLVVDDEPDARELIRRVLSEAGATVLMAAGGREAIAILTQKRPDVVLSDIGMPDLDGYQFIRAIRQMPPTEGGATPAAALTAFARPEDRRRALIAGYQSHITKPIESAELVTVVAALAGRTGHLATALN